MMFGRNHKLQAAFTIAEHFLLFSIISNGIGQMSFTRIQAYIKCMSAIATMALAGLQLQNFLALFLHIKSKMIKI